MSAVPEEAVAAAGEPKPPGVAEAAVAAWRSSRQLVADVLALAAIEARAAGQAAVAMLAMGVVAAICVITAWVLVWAALAAWMAQGLGWGGALLAVSLLNIAVAAGLALVIRQLSARLVFSATRRAVLGRPSAAGEETAGAGGTEEAR
jgi:hypothetical protein